MTVGQLVIIRFGEFSLLDLSSEQYLVRNVRHSRPSLYQWIPYCPGWTPELYVQNSCLLPSQIKYADQSSANAKNCKFDLLFFDVQFCNLEIKSQKYKF